MAPKVTLSQLSRITFLILTIIYSLSAHASSSSTFNSIKHLQGCKKGENVKYLNVLKSYLQQFGYLNYQNHPNQSRRATDDYFDDELEAAVKTYQVNYNLKPTGVLDAGTASKMTMPRCGVPDISNGINHMSVSINNRHGHDHGNYNRKNLNMVSHYELYPGKPKWVKRNLTVHIYGHVADNMFKVWIMSAFTQWTYDSGHLFTFEASFDPKKFDIKVGFERGNHGDSDPFDGPGNVLAHAARPPYGILHFDADEKWWVKKTKKERVPTKSTDLYPIALHEIGHVMGLAHSKVEQAVMYPVENNVRSLHADDIEGIKTLYRV